MRLAVNYENLIWVRLTIEKVQNKKNVIIRNVTDSDGNFQVTLLQFFIYDD